MQASKLFQGPHKNQINSILPWTVYSCTTSSIMERREFTHAVRTHRFQHYIGRGVGFLENGGGGTLEVMWTLGLTVVPTKYIRYHQGPFFYSLLGITEMTRTLHDLAVIGPVAGQSNSQPSDPPTVHVCRNFSPKPRGKGLAAPWWSKRVIQQHVPSFCYSRPTQPWPALQ